MPGLWISSALGSQLSGQYPIALVTIADVLEIFFSRMRSAV
jgi:hypothetical protein